MFPYILLSKLNVFLILFFCSCTITPIVCWLWEINGFWIRRLRKGLGCPPLTGFVHSSSDIPEKSLFAQFLHLWFWSLFAQFLHLWSYPPLDPGVEVYNCTTVFSQEESTFCVKVCDQPRSLQDSAQFWRNFCDSHSVSKLATMRGRRQQNYLFCDVHKWDITSVAEYLTTTDCCVCQRTFYQSKPQHFVSKFATNPEACKILHNSEETSVILTSVKVCDQAGQDLFISQNLNIYQCVNSTLA